MDGTQLTLALCAFAVAYGSYKWAQARKECKLDEQYGSKNLTLLRITREIREDIDLELFGATEGGVCLSEDVPVSHFYFMDKKGQGFDIKIDSSDHSSQLYRLEGKELPMRQWVDILHTKYSKFHKNNYLMYPERSRNGGFSR